MLDSDGAPLTSADQQHLEYGHARRGRFASIIAAFVATLPLAFVLPAGAAFPDVTATAAFAPGIDRATLSAVARTATKGYANPDAAVVSKVRRSKATSGSGYCGEVTIEGGTATTLFHVILRTPRGPSVVRLSDYSRDGDPLTVAANVMMHDFGCTP